MTNENKYDICNLIQGISGMDDKAEEFLTDDQREDYDARRQIKGVRKIAKEVFKDSGFGYQLNRYFGYPVNNTRILSLNDLAEVLYQTGVASSVDEGKEIVPNLVKLPEETLEFRAHGSRLLFQEATKATESEEKMYGVVINGDHIK